MYYRSPYESPYYRRGGRRKRKNLGEYFLPFLIMLCAGVIMVLLIQLYLSFQDQDGLKLENKILAYPVSGKVYLKSWGSNNWDNFYSGTVVLEGDEIKTDSDSKVRLKLYDGSEVRLGESTDFVLESNIKGELIFNLKKGHIWLSLKEDRSFNVKLKGGRMIVNDIGTVFSFFRGSVEKVRVLNGEVIALLRENEKEGVAFVLKTLKVGVGQELVVSQSSLNALAQGRKVALLSAIDEDFKMSDWYKWNRIEDSKFNLKEVKSEVLESNVKTSLKEEEVEVLIPSKETKIELDKIKIEEEVKAEEQGEKVDNLIENKVDALKKEEISVVNQKIVIPSKEEKNNFIQLEEKEPINITVLNPKKEETIFVDVDKVVISGDVTNSVVKVTVYTFSEEGGKTPYVLSKFKKGDKTWSYVAALVYKNLVVGENIFEIVGFDELGNKTEIQKVKFEYKDSKLEKSSDDLSLTLDQSKLDLTLVAPGVVKIDGQPYLDEGVEVERDKVLVEGTVDRNATKIVVNGYALKLFSPGKGAWSYYAAKDYDTLKKGENIYTVYALDKNGNRSEEKSFRIYRK